MSSSLRVPEEMLKSWVETLSPRTDLRGAPAIAKEMEAALAKASEGYVVLGRHQLFTWGEALQGIARRAPLGSPAQVVADELRAVLGGREAAKASVAAPVAPAPPPSSHEWRPPPANLPPAYVAPPPIVYGKPNPSGGGSAGLRLVAEGEIAPTVAGLVREARRELLVVSPWTLGLETLAPELVRTPASVTMRIVSRRPDREDEAYHRTLRDLQRRGAELVMSPFLHTRMILADNEILLLGAAGLPKPGVNVQREAALVTSDPQAVAAARAHFERILDEARRGPPR